VATHAVQICNKALLRVGQRQLIGDLAEDTTEAQACNALYDMAVDEVLSEVPWRWATLRATLALIGVNAPMGWAYAYALPEDCITARYVLPESVAAPIFPPNFDTSQSAPGREGRVPFIIKYNATSGRSLFTDQENASLVYTARVTVVPHFPPLFVDALAWKLASDLALALPVKPQVGLAMLQGYKQALAVAVLMDVSQGQTDTPPDAEHIRVR
jgi:hypothetical protein